MQAQEKAELDELRKDPRFPVAFRRLGRQHTDVLSAILTFPEGPLPKGAQNQIAEELKKSKQFVSLYADLGLRSLRFNIRSLQKT